MEIVGQLQKQYVDFITSLFREEYLDDQYVQLQKLQDDSNPEFVVEVVSIFFEDSEKLLNDLAASLQQKVVDFEKVDGYVHQFKGSSSSVGAQRVKNACVAFRNFCEEKNLDGRLQAYSAKLKSKCSRFLNMVKQEFYLVKNKLETLLRLRDRLITLKPDAAQNNLAGAANPAGRRDGSLNRTSARCRPAMEIIGRKPTS